MSKTILITGTSSGIGRATALLFANKGWNVVATQRNPEQEKELQKYPNLLLCELDVTKPETIHQSYQHALNRFGSIEVVVNNAGYGVDGVFEAMDDQTIEKQFNTNVFGLMRVTREAIGIMREQKKGTIIQISSVGGKITFPLFSIYHATKFAVEGFTESLHYELAPLNIQLKLIEPGIIATEFTGKSRVFVKPAFTNEYDNYLEKFKEAAEKAYQNAEKPEVIAKEIYKAATDGKTKLRYPIGAPAPLILKLRKLLSDSLFFKMVRATYKV